MRNEGCREQVRVLGSITPATSIPSKNIPRVGDVGAGEDGQYRKGKAPKSNQHDADGARAEWPGTLVKDP